MNGRDNKDLEQLKRLRLKLQDVTSKNIVITEKKEKQYARQTYISTRYIYLQTLPLILTGQMNQPFNMKFLL